jgi:multidrug resistance protein
MNWKIFRILFFAIFSSVLGQGIVVPLLPVYAQKLGATGIHIGLIFGAFSFSMSVVLPFIGRLSDRSGRKPFIIVGLFAYFAASVAFMFSSNVTALIVIRFLQGIAAAMITPVAEAYIGDITPRGKEGMVMGLMNVAYCGGLSAGPFIGGIAKDAFGMQAAFFIMGMICLCGFMMSSLLLPSRKEEKLIAKNTEPPRYRVIFQSRHITGLFLFRFAYSICLGIVWSFAPLIADKEYGFSGTATGMVIMLGVFVSAVIMTPMGHLADRFSKRMLMAAGGLVTFAAMFFFTRLHASWELYAVSILVGVGNGVSMPPVMAMTVILGRKNAAMGTIISLLILAESMGAVAGSVLGGSIVDIWNMKAAFGSGGAVMLLATLLGMYLTSDFRRLEKG